MLSSLRSYSSSFLLFSLALLQTPQALGQLTLQRQDYASPGDSVFYENSSFRDSVGSEGQNLIWDFSFLDTTHMGKDTTIIEVPNNAPGSSSFPNADATLPLAFADSQYAFADITPSAVKFLGLYFSILNISFPLVMNQPLDLVQFPSSYGNSFQSTSTAQNAIAYDTTLNISGINYDVDSVRLSVNITLKGDVNGEGTLYLPHDTMAVLRQQNNYKTDFTVEAYGCFTITPFPTQCTWVTIPTSMLPLPSNNIEANTVSYFAQSRKMAVLEFTTEPSLDSINACRYQFQKLLSADTVSNKTLNAPSATQIRLYPNPVQDQLFLQNTQQWQQYQVYNLQGQKITEGILPKRGQVKTIPTYDLPQGTYLLRLIDEHQKRYKTLKFVK